MSRNDEWPRPSLPLASGLPTSCWPREPLKVISALLQVLKGRGPRPYLLAPVLIRLGHPLTRLQMGRPLVLPMGHRLALLLRDVCQLFVARSI